MFNRTDQTTPHEFFTEITATAGAPVMRDDMLFPLKPKVTGKVFPQMPRT